MPSSQTDIDTRSRQLNQLRDDVDELLKQLDAAERTWSRWLAGVAAVHRHSARNMLHYWAIRQHDLRDLQASLAEYGLSSLGRSEPHVEATLISVRSANPDLPCGPVQKSVSDAQRLGAIITARWATSPPNECPSRCGRSRANRSANSMASQASEAIV